MKIDFKGIKAVVFDFDGTLYNNRHFPFWFVMADLSEIFIMKKERTFRKDMQGVDLKTKEAFEKEFYGRLATAKKCSFESAKVWYENDFMNRFISVLEKHYFANDKVEEVFGKLNQKGIATAVYSDYPMLPQRMKAVGLPENLTRNCWCAPTMGAFKPACRPMYEIAQSLSVSCSEILMVGDREDTDGESAFSCGAKFVRIRKNDKDYGELDYPFMTWDEFANKVLSL